jgi:hypothetical protein
MIRTKDVIKKSGLLKWLSKAVLVLGLLTFSGHVSEFRLYNSGPTKTELNEVRSVNTKRTVSLNKILNGLNSIIRTDQFVFRLLHQDNRIALKLRINFVVLPTNEQDAFLLHYSATLSDEFITNQVRG